MQSAKKCGQINIVVYRKKAVASGGCGEEGESAWILGDEHFRLGIVVSGATGMKAGFAAKRQKTSRVSPGFTRVSIYGIFDHTGQLLMITS